MTRLLRQFVGLVGIALGTNVAALATTIDFDSLADGATLTDQLSGLTFSNAVVLTAGNSLNEFEFPPRSSPNVIFDAGGPLQVVFATPVASLFAYLTYAVPVTLSAYDATDTVVGSSISAFASNLALTGDVGSLPNEEFSVVYAAGITRAVFTGDPAGGSFTLDNLTFEPGQSSVPEPTTAALALVGLAVLFSRRRRMAR